MKYETVLEKFDAHFCPKSNITYLRFKFFNVTQKETQPVDDFINELKTRAQECEFKDLTESLIRDRIVCGVKHLKLQERLLREPELTLDRAILLCKADEDTRKQTSEIQRNTLDGINIKIDNIKMGHKNYTKHARSSKDTHKQAIHPGKQKKNSCHYCGKVHPKGKCPAYGKVCSSCGKVNHFAAVCLTSKRVKSVNVYDSSNSTDYEDNAFFIGSVKVEDDKRDENKNISVSHDKGNQQESPELDDENNLFVDAITSEIDHENDWILPLQTSGTEINYKLDTGAQCNIIPKKIYDRIPNKPKLHKAKAKLTVMMVVIFK